MSKLDKIAQIEAMLAELKADGGEPEIDPAVEYSETMDAIRTVAKANAGLDATLDFGEPEELSGDPVEAVAKAAGIELEDGQDVDALPFLTALMQCNNRIADGQGVLGENGVAIRKDLAVVAKGVALVMERFEDLDETIRSWGDSGRGSRTARAARAAGAGTVVPMAKGVGPEQRTGQEPDGAEDPGDLRGMELVAKAVSYAQHAPDILTPTEINRIEAWGREGYGLVDLMGKGRLPMEDASPDLVAKFFQAQKKAEKALAAA